MYRVELYARVRRACRVEGMSTREASRVFGVDRKTVRKMLSFSVPPGYRRSAPPRRPKLGPFTGIIDRILPSSAASPDPSCTTTPSWRLPGSWAMGSGSERASSRSFSPTICSRTGSADRARATTRARSRDWSASSGGTSWSPSRVPRASRPSTMLSANSAAGARRRGCGATRRPSASVSSGIVKFSCHCRRLPMMPAISALDGRVRCRWCVTAATTIPCPWPTATVRCSSGATSI